MDTGLELDVSYLLRNMHDLFVGPFTKGWAMAEIERIDVQLKTGAHSDAGTDGEVFLFIGGREFRINQKLPHNDRERGKTDNLILGKDSNIEDSDNNDPRKAPLTFENITKFPVWLRFEPKPKAKPNEPDDDWNLDFAVVKVSAKADASGVAAEKTYKVLTTGSDSIWLGRSKGLFVYLL